MLDIVLTGVLSFLTGVVVTILTSLAVKIWADDNIRPNNPVARLRRDNDE